MSGRHIRSALFVPGDSKRKLAKAPSASADALIFDCEDSVAPDRKPTARRMIAEHLTDGAATGAQRWVRINDLRTADGALDLNAIVLTQPTGVMLPKCEGLADIERLSAKLALEEAKAGVAIGSTRVIVILGETARAVLRSASEVPLTHPRLAAFTWGSEDLMSDLRAGRKRNPGGDYTATFAMARAQTLLTAAAAGVPALDTVHGDYRDLEGLQTECRDAWADGFTGKLAIHPAQIEIINQVMQPSTDEVDEARAVLKAFDTAPDAGVVRLNGRMLDQPHFQAAKRTLELAR